MRQAATGISKIDELVNTFIDAEDQNFSLFNYVNELNNEVPATHARTDGRSTLCQRCCRYDECCVPMPHSACTPGHARRSLSVGSRRRPRPAAGYLKWPSPRASTGRAVVPRGFTYPRQRRGGYALDGDAVAGLWPLAWLHSACKTGKTGAPAGNA